MKTLEILSILFAVLFVVLMVCSVLFYSVAMVICSLACMAISMFAMCHAYSNNAE